MKRPKSFLGCCHQRFDSWVNCHPFLVLAFSLQHRISAGRSNMVETFTRQVNLYQFQYVTTSDIARNWLWAQDSGEISVSL